jgi:hypothetical protein
MTIADDFIKRVAPALSRLIGGIRTASSYLTPKDDWVEGLKRRFALLGDPLLAPLGRPLVAEKGRADYVCTVEADTDKVEVAVMARYQRNLTSTRKYRVIEGDRDWAVGSFVHDPEDTDWQHHVYLFDNDDGTTDVYAHKETSAEHDPYGHVTDPQVHGDPDGLARGTLEEAHLTYA